MKPVAGDGPPRSGAVGYLEMAGRLEVMLSQQVDLLQAEPVPTGFDEARVKALLSLSRALQAMEELTRRLELAADERGGNAEDIVAFRERLAKQLDALGEIGADEPVS